MGDNPAARTQPFGPWRHLAAWGVHLLTASGAVLALLALAAIHRGRYAEAFAWMAVALAIDSIDGTLARAVAVRTVLPTLDGARLDDVVDYLNYTLVPLALIYASGRLPSPLALPVVAFVLLASAYGFAQTDAKTNDGYFKGFPSYWNVVAFYIYALDTPQWFGAAALVLFGILVFVPTYYVYPSRSPRFRTITIGLGVVWAITALVILARLEDAPRSLVWASLLYPAYYFGLSVYLTRRR
jgi:phosphatidylcholine synthase